MIRVLILLAAALAAGAASARAPDVRAELLPGWRLPDGRHVAAIRLSLPAGWKTYWRSPGMSGIPAVADWSGSRGVSGAEILWPAPTAFRSFGMRVLGYEGEVVLPVAVTVRGGGAAELDLRLTFGVCEEICVPMSVRLTSALPGGGALDPVIAAALARVPERRTGIARCGMGEAGGGPALVARLSVPSLGPGETVAMEAPGALLGEPRISRSGGTLTATFPIRGGAISRDALRVTAFGPGGAVEQAGCPAG